MEPRPSFSLDLPQSFSNLYLRKISSQAGSLYPLKTHNFTFLRYGVLKPSTRSTLDPEPLIHYLYPLKILYISTQTHSLLLLLQVSRRTWLPPTQTDGAFLVVSSLCNTSPKIILSQFLFSSFTIPVFGTVTNKTKLWKTLKTENGK